MTILSHITSSYSTDNIAITNPANNEIVGYVPSIDNKSLTQIIDLAVTAQKSWSKTTGSKRAALLRKWHELIITHADELAEIITLENGKVLLDAKSEIAYGASFVEWFASQATEIYVDDSKGLKPGQRIITAYEPVGVVAAITPWNFPNAMITRKISPALAAGCTIILKPSELTPLSALALGYLAQKAGFPEGVVNIVSGDSHMIGKTLCDDFRIRKISFTGSTNVGKILYEQSAGTLKRLSLELGGNAPFIICPDADVTHTIECLIPAKIRSSSQACTSPNRIFIHSDIYDEVTKILAEKFSKIKPGIDIGPLINQKSVDKVMHLIKDATSKGAQVLCGGEVSTGTFFKPTVIIDCADNMDIFRAEIFAPVLACYRFSSIEEVIMRANDTEYGLASYVFSKNKAITHKLSEELDFGMVGVNTAIVSNYRGAFAGRKASGFGVEGGHLGIYEYLNTKYLCVE